MSWCAASAAQTRRKAQATTAEPKTRMAGMAGRCVPLTRSTRAGTATTRAKATLRTAPSTSARPRCQIGSGGRRLRGAEARFAVLLEHAAIHHHRQPGGLGALGRRLVDHAFLHPDGGNAQADGVVDVRAH